MLITAVTHTTDDTTIAIHAAPTTCTSTSFAATTSISVIQVTDH